MEATKVSWPFHWLKRIHLLGTDVTQVSEQESLWAAHHKRDGQSLRDLWAAVWWHSLMQSF